MTPTCPCCAAAALDVHSGLAQAGCAQCVARRLSLAPQAVRQAAYAAASDADRGSLVRDVRRAYTDRMERIRGACAAATKYVKAGVKG